MKVVLSQTISLSVNLDIDPADKEQVRKVREAIASREIRSLTEEFNMHFGMVAIDNLDFWAIDPN